ncbi:MAG: prolipoprotein diacylglyceryl transferase [Defluviitaleaceae bacterium]|nr:prolipoprotein diacylglyceryl transferase [Defluviitaleaceae bacterium]MCL2261828.1 prolipoprotein diacylglyceryl transferase [Defluviitaleaceae bacterium]
MPQNYVAPDIAFPNLGLSFNNVPRVAVSLFGLDIYMYAVSIVVGIIAAYFLGIWWVKKSGQKVDDYQDLLLFGIPMAVVGLRLYYVIFNWNRYSGQNFFRVFFGFRDGGLAIYGGIIAAALAAFIIAKRKKIPFTTITDTAAPSMLLGQVIGRFGNFFNREAFGGYTDNLFAMQIRADQVLGTHHITNELRENMVYFNGVQYFQVHPTFLYEAFFNFLLMLALLIYRPRKRFGGEILLLYFFGYGIIRFFVESLRTDQMMFLNTGLPLNQLVAILFAIASAILIIAGHLHYRRFR